MVVCDIGKLFHRLIQRLLCLELVQIDAFIFQCVKIPFHRSVIVRWSCFAHTLAHMDGFTEFHKGLWRILGALIAVEDQFFFDLRLWFQRFLQSSDSKAAGDLALCHACNDAPIIQVNNAAIIARFPVFQKQICEIRTPLVVCPLCLKLPLQLVFKNFMRFSAPVTRFLRADEGIQLHFCIHVFMYGNRAVMIASTCQINSHGPVSGHPVMRMVNFPDLYFYRFFLGIIIRLPVFSVVVISVRADAKPPQYPADAEFSVMLLNKPISL